jgi:hypothetical protein
MALTNAPLLGTKHDEQLFVGRLTERQELLRNVEMGWNTLVLGPPGSGKTSLLNRFAADLENRLQADTETGRRPIAFRVTGRPDGAADLFGVLTAQMVRRLEGEGVTATFVPTARQALEKLQAAGLPATLSRSSVGRDTTAELLQMLRMVGSVIDDLRGAGIEAVIVVDELMSSEIAHTVFGRLRDELWTLRATWIVAGRSQDSETLLMPPADTFFEQKVVLGRLTHVEAVALLRARLRGEAVVDLSDEEIDQLARIGRGHPLALVAALRAVASGVPTGEIIERSRRLAASLKTLSPPGRRLAHLILDSAQPARATDQPLLRQLGWSASRLRQVLHELAEAGIVNVVDGQAERPGRPSKLYVPVVAGFSATGDTRAVTATTSAERHEAGAVDEPT